MFAHMFADYYARAVTTQTPYSSKDASSREAEGIWSYGQKF